jgi:pimeloyl-ACP methyl ester carboxylesterase
MTLVLVHGNPESDAIWQPLIAELGRDDVVCLSPPGFGAPVPAGFGATVADYRDWLVGELERFDSPVDLVGHDWGGGHVVNVAMSRPDLLRTWATDVIGLFDPDYVWHDLAQMWQTPVQGEAVVASMMGGTAEKRAEGMQKMGLPLDIALQVTQAQGEEMGQCILSLYRSAAQPAMAELGKNLPAAAARPGLSILATGDQFVGKDQEMRRRSAERAGARTELLEGLGHWWMLQDPAAGANIINNFLKDFPS